MRRHVDEQITLVAPDGRRVQAGPEYARANSLLMNAMASGDRSRIAEARTLEQRAKRLAFAGQPGYAAGTIRRGGSLLDMIRDASRTCRELSATLVKRNPRGCRRDLARINAFLQHTLARRPAVTPLMTDDDELDLLIDGFLDDDFQ